MVYFYVRIICLYFISNVSFLEMFDRCFMKVTDTIAAISTSTGNSGIGIIRVSGDEAIEIVDRVFKSNKEGKKLCDVNSHTVHYGHIIDGNKTLDQVLVIVMKNPHSYTGEDTVEIDCHGGMLILQKVLELVIRNGAKAAASARHFVQKKYLRSYMKRSALKTKRPVSSVGFANCAARTMRYT